METSPLSPAASTHIDWARVELPDAWPDRLGNTRLHRLPFAALRLLGLAIFGHRTRVALPTELKDIVDITRIPRYVLQEFHNLPNGNYSKRLTRGYARWFDRLMLGTLHAARAQIAQAISQTLRETGTSSQAVALDIGCGAGHMAGALHAAGLQKVWGLEPSPYLLQQAALTYPGIHWLHGVAEQIDLPDASVDAVSICFVLHEVPPLYLQRILEELRRVMKPGALLALIEPSSVQWNNSFRQQWRQHGWRGVYFKLLARNVFEPFADAWHRQDFTALLLAHGFTLHSDDTTGCPLRILHARKDAPANIVQALGRDPNPSGTGPAPNQV